MRGPAAPRVTPLREIGSRRALPAVLAAALICVQCADRGAGPPPPPPTPAAGAEGEAPPVASTPEIAMENLERAFEERDLDLYESLLDEGFFFTEADCRGGLAYWNDRENELAIISADGDGSRQGVFEVFQEIEFHLVAEERYDELGADSPMAFEGDVDGHPEEDWHVYRGRVEMLLLHKPDEGFWVDQMMTFKLRQDEAGTWRIRRWADDPLARDCSESGEEPVAESWGRIKASLQ